MSHAYTNKDDRCRIAVYLDDETMAKLAYLTEMPGKRRRQSYSSILRMAIHVAYATVTSRKKEQSDGTSADHC